MNSAGDRSKGNMPGLYRSKHKRLTSNSSYPNQSQQDDSVWHSTPINTSGTSTGSGILGESAGALTSMANEVQSNETMMSPVKRVAIGEGDRPVPLGMREARKETPGPSRSAAINIRPEVAHRLLGTPTISTPQRTAVEDIVMDTDDEKDQELFDDMVSLESKGKGSEGRKETSNFSKQQNADETTADDEGESRMHISDRFGPVLINPPSGHTYFSRILQENGFILTLPKNHLKIDVLHFRENMNKWLEEHHNEKSRVEDECSKFIRLMKKYFSSKENVLHSCTTTLNDRECIQPSLLACLLGVKFTQMPLFEVILPTIAEAGFSSTQEDVDFVGTIVNQMKWLPVLVDGKMVADKLLDILETASIHSQKHIIRLLPEIFLPEYHSILIPKLMEIFDMGTQVNVAMLDCFSCLVTPEADCLKIRRSTVDQMAAAPLEDIPAYLSFLFRVGCTNLQLEEGIKEMRDKIEIKPKFKIPKEDALQVEILERIRFFVSVNPAIIKIWLTQIKDDLGCDVDHLPTIDLIMLLIFVESGDKLSHIVFSSLFTKPKLLNTLFDKMMENNNQMLHELFPAISRFLDNIHRTKNSKSHEAAVYITKKIFVGLGPVLSQQLTSNLIGVLINGHSTCRDVVLQIFNSIAETDAKKLLYFHSYLMGALVYVMKYPPRQMQALMNILALLAYMPENLNGEENAFTAEFMILLRKQITHSNLKTRSFGVLGTIAAVEQLARHNPVENQEKIDNLLALAWQSIKNDEEVCNIFFDKLIEIVHLLPKEICSYFRDILKQQFEKLWTQDQASDSQLLQCSTGQANLALRAAFDANKEMERDKLIITLEPHSLQMSPLVVPSHFRVMAELERMAEGGDMEGIDAVLGSPVFFPKLSYFDEKELDSLTYNERLKLGQYLVITINYFRECISAFVDSDNVELRVKVWLRLQNVVTLQKILVKNYTSLPNLPMGYGGENTLKDVSSPKKFGGGPSTSAAAAQAKKVVTAVKKTKKPRPPKKAKKSKKKKKATDGDDDDEEEEEEAVEILGDEDETQNKNNASTSVSVSGVSNPMINFEDTIQPKFIFSNIRHFDSKVFQLIRRPFRLRNQPFDYSGILHNLSIATQSRETMEDIEQFDTETLSLLLIELKTQVTDKAWHLDILSIDSILVNLCSHLDSVSDAIQNQNEQRLDEAKKFGLRSCLRLIINVLELYFLSISKSDKELRKKLTNEAILVLSSKYKSDTQDEDDLEETLKSQVELLLNTAKYMGNVINVIEDDPRLAYDHIKLLKVFHDLLPRQDQLKTAIDQAAKNYLRRDWKLSSDVINFLLKTWLDVTPQPMKVIKQLVHHLLSEGEDGNDCIPNSSVYQSCTKLNFHTWYSTIFSSLAQHVMKYGKRRGDFDDSIDLWNQGNDLLKELIIVSQQSKMRKALILIPLLRNSRIYLEAFVSGGVCLLPELWTRDIQKGKLFTKTLQNSTRKLQNICEFAKITKDSKLLRYVPPLKKVLELLLFRVRETMGNVAPNAFWVGALKLRDLDGELMNSQPFNSSSQCECPDSEDDENESEVGNPHDQLGHEANFEDDYESGSDEELDAYFSDDEPDTGVGMSDT